jgi:hypothetical protein
MKEPVIIIAAARSGTKILRYILSASHAFASYPYDANYIWKYGNYHVKHDQLEPEHADPNKQKKIRSFFFQICEKENKPRLLEKSVPNSLRIPFVRTIFPDCKIIYLYRNGFDVAADARLCWQASARSDRIQSKEDRMRKLKEFPFSMAWPYLFEYCKSYSKRVLFRQGHVESWGPRYNGIDVDVRHKSLIEVCARQWAGCVEHCSRELSKLEKGQDFICISYEQLVSRPVEQLSRIVSYLNISDGERILEKGKKAIRTDFMEEWKKNLSEKEHRMIRDIVQKHHDMQRNFLGKST